MSAEFLRHLYISAIELTGRATAQSAAQKERHKQNDEANCFLRDHHLSKLISSAELFQTSNYDQKGVVLLNLDWQKISILQPKKDPNDAPTYYIHYEAIVPEYFQSIFDNKQLLNKYGGELGGYAFYALRFLRLRAEQEPFSKVYAAQAYTAILEKLSTLGVPLSPVILYPQDRALYLAYLQESGDKHLYDRALGEIKTYEEDQKRRRQNRGIGNR
jgi:hypothetical protein